MIFHSCGLHVVHGSEHGRYVLSYTKGICLHICYLARCSTMCFKLHYLECTKIGHNPHQSRLLVLTDTVVLSVCEYKKPGLFSFNSLQRQDLKI